ncbi:MAG: hypothetical protein EOP24_41145 [Hyphomicrobiales bacterium]|nr:MAG: hypothetical protein EOP24_41145 [Hyphomicrobiales bacterium]
MIVTAYDTNTEVDAVLHYQIIRRDGAVVPFEPRKISDAMVKAYLAAAGCTIDPETSSPTPSRFLQVFFSRVSLWRGHIKLQARQCKTAMSGQGARMQQRARDGLQLRVGSGLGFFSAVKPNLHNAP